MSTTGSSDRDGQTFPLHPAAPAKAFTLRDLYERASISGNSMAAELGRYLNVGETTFSPKEMSQANISSDELNVHERALAAILEVVTSEFNATFEHVRVPEPQGGVQEWWSRMLSGSVDNSHPTSDYPAIGESL